ncbi:dnaJ [Symbiodinium natans]|uniref:DnaJ protein n=1 Tax=Symbiodinium natans TaxID=878477 RepID=A0A812RI17_9DINO|nr:dnaJ [Symbiodinium natans]
MNHLSHEEVAEQVVGAKFFHGEFTPQGFKRYSGLWKGPPPGNIGKKDIAVGVQGLIAQMKNPMFVTKGGVGYGVDETQKVEDDGKGWVWLAAEMSPGGLALELFKSVPYGKRALLVAQQSNVDELFSKVNWDVALGNIEKTFGGPQIKQRCAHFLRDRQAAREKDQGVSIPGDTADDLQLAAYGLHQCSSGLRAMSSRLLVQLASKSRSAVLACAAFTATRFVAFVTAPATPSPPLRRHSAVALAARGGGEFDISDADIQTFYQSLLTGNGGDPPKGTVLSELVVKFFHGEFTPQGFKRYSGLWKGPPPGNIGKKDIAVGVQGLIAQMKNPMFVTKGGVGYGVDETQKVEDDGKGWVWLAAEMSPGGLALELFKSVPYGKRALLVAQQSNVDELFSKVNWDVALGNIEKTFGGPQIKQR